MPANEYLNLGGGKFSTSRGNVIGLNTVLREFQPDAWRYVLTAMAPETADVEFTWQDFMDRVNNELVANWGNLVNRMLGFAYKRFDGRIPTPGALDDDRPGVAGRNPRRLRAASANCTTAVKLKAALPEVRRLSQRVNQYLNEKAPWKSDQDGPGGARRPVGLRGVAGDRLAQAPVGADPAAQQRSGARYLGLFDTSSLAASTRNVVDDARGSHLVAALRPQPGATGRWEADVLPPVRSCASRQRSLSSSTTTIMAEKVQAVI